VDGNAISGSALRRRGADQIVRIFFVNLQNAEGLQRRAVVAVAFADRETAESIARAALLAKGWEWQNVRLSKTTRLSTANKYTGVMGDLIRKALRNTIAWRSGVKLQDAAPARCCELGARKWSHVACVCNGH
jgi:hypothetical protein